MGTFGKTTPSAALEDLADGFEIVSKYTLSSNQTIYKLTAYLDGGGSAASSNQVMKGLIYADSAGTPAALLGVSLELEISFNAPTAWYDLVLVVAASLTAGDYWLGLHGGTTGGGARYGSDVPPTNNRKYHAQPYASGPSNPFGTVDGSDDHQIDIYGSWIDVGTNLAPVIYGRGAC